MATKKSVGVLKEAELKGKRVFVRVDLNVPLDDSLKMSVRVRAAVPTIKYLMGHGARVILASHLEARVRFSGYGKADDEWVNVKTELRERSIPLEPSECHKVQDGDLVLCFRDGAYQAIYYDAHIIEIERKQHDGSGCTCIFTVRYDHDSFEKTASFRDYRTSVTS